MPFGPALAGLRPSARYAIFAVPVLIAIAGCAEPEPRERWYEAVNIKTGERVVYDAERGRAGLFSGCASVIDREGWDRTLCADEWKARPIPAITGIDK